MAQVSRRTKTTRIFLGAVLAASVVVGGFSLKNMLSADIVHAGSVGSTAYPEPPPAPGSVQPPHESSTGNTPTQALPDNSGSTGNVVVQAPAVNAEGAEAKDQQTLYALIISLITSITSVLGLLMSKYTEWQRSRLEQMKLAVELQQKELELQEMRRKLQGA